MKNLVIALAAVAVLTLGISLICSMTWAAVIIWLPTPTPNALIIESTSQAPAPGQSPTLAHAQNTIPPAAPQSTQYPQPTATPTNRPPMVAPRLPAATATPRAYPVASETPPPRPTEAPPQGPTATEQTDIGLPPVPPTEAP